MAALRAAESRILQYLHSSYKGTFINIRNCIGNKDNYIWTITLNDESQRTPLVLLHGMGSGVALWCFNLDALSENRPVYACDILGFGRSSRPPFSLDGEKAESQFVDSIERWREELKLEKFILLGHSMGGYLASSYALQFPHRVKHLILADPWGFPERPANYDTSSRPFLFRALAAILRPFNPFGILRALGPWGPQLIIQFRRDLVAKFSPLIKDDSIVPDYLYHCNAQTPSGETAFHAMCAKYGWAKRPMMKRICELDPNVPITFIYGARSWIDATPGIYVKTSRTNSFVDFHVVKNASHHVYADSFREFNFLVTNACEKADGNSRYFLDLLAAASEHSVPELTSSDKESEDGDQRNKEKGESPRSTKVSL